MSEDIVTNATVLRGKAMYQEAIDFVLKNKDNLTKETFIPAFLQALYAAESLNDRNQAELLAHEIAKEDADVPTIQKYL